MTDHKSIISQIHKSDFYLWIIFFIYTALVSMAIQFVVLPYCLPQIHWGEGLLAGTDSITFHLYAKSEARRIVNEGWHTWLLSPLGQAPAGIASAFYALFIPKPWIMIPFYAALHSGSAIILLKIVSLFGRKTDRRIKIASVLPFLAFPSAAFWYAQLHRDSYFIFGNFLFIFAWLLWLEKRSPLERLPLKQYFYCLSMWILAYILIWIIRPYWRQVLFINSILIFLLLTINQIYFLARNRAHWQKRGFYWALSFIAILAFGLAIQKKDLPSNMISEMPASEELNITLEWNPDRWLPVFLDSQLRSMAMARRAFLIKYPEAGTNVDVNVTFHSAKEMVSYLPKALYAGFFMPTTSITFQKGLKPEGTLMRWVTGLEMIIVYFCYPFILIALWSWRKKLELWILLIWAIGAVLMFAVVSPNIGALYRFRYGFIMTLIALGILRAGILTKRGQKGKDSKNQRMNLA